MKKYAKDLPTIMLMAAAMLFFIACNPEDKDENAVRVTTNMPEEITPSSAVCSGEVTLGQGLSLAEVGFCWGNRIDPTVNDAHQSAANASVSFSCTITDLQPSTQYYLRAYAVCGSEYYYGPNKIFVTANEAYDGHEYVDLGLPSGTLWAACNVGAEKPEEYGDYFAWGETETKAVYSWDTYKYSEGSYNTLTKYCTNFYYGFEGYTDTLTMLLPEDDAATVHWGEGWHTPTHEEWEELCQYTTWEWANIEGTLGRMFTASNGHSLFLPSAGSIMDEGPYNTNTSALYWSSSLQDAVPHYVWYLTFSATFIDEDCRVDVYGRFPGCSVRPVRSAR